MKDNKKKNNVDLLAEDYLIDLPTGGGPGAYDDSTITEAFKAGYNAAVDSLKCCANCKKSGIMYPNTYDLCFYCEINDLVHPYDRCEQWEQNSKE